MTATDRTTSGPSDDDIIELSSSPCLLHELDAEGRMPPEPASPASPAKSTVTADEHAEAKRTPSPQHERRDD